MNSKLKLYSVSDKYINYLRKYDSKVYDNKVTNRNHKRKYLGVVLNINNYNYFIPLSSPKKTDYLNGIIRKDTSTIIRIHNSNELFGTLRLSNMIPVPNDEIKYYNVIKESDEYYKYIVLNELRYINKNEMKIRHFTYSLYSERVRNLNKNYLKNTVNFKLLECKCNQWVNNKNTVNN